MRARLRSSGSMERENRMRSVMRCRRMEEYPLLVQPRQCISALQKLEMVSLKSLRSDLLDDFP